MSRVTNFPLGWSSVPGWILHGQQIRSTIEGGGELVMITLMTRTGDAVRTALHWADDWTLLAFNADPTLTH
jgi:hypothetical protein